MIKVESIRGMNITIKTSALNNEEAKDLLVALNFPFRNLKENQKEEV